MNAPVSDAALARPTLQLMAIAAMVPSKSHVQEVRRSRFVKKEIEELADDIRRNGMMHQPIVRLNDAGKHEIVTGEQRWLAAKVLGMKELYVNVRELTEEAALEMQLSENLRRKDLHELEEAEGYEELMKLKRVTIEALADMVGRSVSYVNKRKKLLDLSPDARKAFYAGEMDASTALLIARIPGDECQKRAMKALKEEQDCGEIRNFKEASEFLRDNFMLRLKEAPFDRNDDRLVPAAGSCQKCPKRTGNQKDLFGDVKDGDLCTDAKCFADKRQAHYTIAVRHLEAKGKKVIHADAAKKILPNWEDNSGTFGLKGYVQLDEYHPDLNGKLKDVLPDDVEPVLIQHPGTGKIFEAVSSQALTKLKLQKKHGKTRAAPKAQKAKKPSLPDLDDQLTERLAQMIVKNAPKTFGRAWLLDLSKVVFDKLNLRDDDAVAKAFGWPATAFSRGYNSKLPAQTEKLDERGLVLFMFQLVFATRWGRESVLKLFGIKEHEVRELIIEERKAARSKPAAATKRAK